jgi:hypothetical protein
MLSQKEPSMPTEDTIALLDNPYTLAHKKEAVIAFLNEFPDIKRKMHKLCEIARELKGKRAILALFDLTEETGNISLIISPQLL